MKIWTCFSCGTEYETEEVLRCVECFEPLCNACYAQHTDDHRQPSNWKLLAWSAVGVIALVAIILTLISL